MRIKQLLLTAAAAAILTTMGTATGALARDRDRDGRPDHSWSERHDRDGYRDGRYRDRDRDGRRDGGWRERHDGDGYMDRGRNRDRYWRHGYGGYVGHDTVYRGLRHHGYHRWTGAPYWYHGRYVIRTYNRWGRVVLVEINPYTGGFIGVIRF